MEEPNSPIPNNATLQSSTSSTTTNTTTNNNNNSNIDNNALTKTISTTSTTNSVSTPTSITGATLPDNCPIASEKDNQYFHALFKSVPENDRLIEIYKCALHREILLQGHLYISEHHICFHANIFGWITNLVIEYSEIVLIERRMTAMIIPNGIQIDTHHAKHTFASFIYREAAYQRLVSLWESHQKPSSSSSLLSGEDDDDDDWSVTSGDDDSITSSSSNYDNQDSLKHSLHHHHHHENDSSSIPLIGSLLNKWKGILLCFLFFHSVFLMKQWFHLERQLHHHHQLQHHHQHYYHPYTTPFHKSSSSLQEEDRLSLSDFLTHSTTFNNDKENEDDSFFSSSSLKMNHNDHQQLYQKLDQLRLKMDGLNQQIIDQQLHLYDLSLNIKQNME
ncbi:unnamed protein product [Cunninghamella blakesleeana]